MLEIVSGFKGRESLTAEGAKVYLPGFVRILRVVYAKDAKDFGVDILFWNILVGKMVE